MYQTIAVELNGGLVWMRGVQFPPDIRPLRNIKIAGVGKLVVTALQIPRIFKFHVKTRELESVHKFYSIAFGKKACSFNLELHRLLDSLKGVFKLPGPGGNELQPLIFRNDIGILWNSFSSQLHL